MYRRWLALVHGCIACASLSKDLLPKYCYQRRVFDRPVKAASEVHSCINFSSVPAPLFAGLLIPISFIHQVPICAPPPSGQQSSSRNPQNLLFRLVLFHEKRKWDPGWGFQFLRSLTILFSVLGWCEILALCSLFLEWRVLFLVPKKIRTLAILSFAFLGLISLPLSMASLINSW